MDKKNNKYYYMKDVCTFLGVTRKNILNLERLGLVKPDFINANSYRCYSAETIARIEYIHRLRLTDLTLNEIKSLMEGEKDYSYFKNILTQRKESIEYLLEQLQIFDDFARYEYVKPFFYHCYVKENIMSSVSSVAEAYLNAKLTYIESIDKGGVVNSRFPFFSIVNISLDKENNLIISKKRTNYIPIINKNLGEDFTFNSSLKITIRSADTMFESIKEGLNKLIKDGKKITGRLMTSSESGPISIQNKYIIRLYIEYQD